MSTDENKTTLPDTPSRSDEPKSSFNSGQVLAGLVVLTVGSILLSKQIGVVFPEWMFTWQMLVITVGIFVGAKSQFRDSGWLTIVAVGAVFMAIEFVQGFSWNMAWPIIIIVVGLGMIMNSGKGRRRC